MITVPFYSTILFYLFSILVSQFFILMMPKIPIFPLNLVVFPGSKYPLHIFEERYKTMVKKSLADNLGFGIVASIENRIFDVGAYVEIDSLFKTYPNGNMDIVIRGIKRFLIKSTSLHNDGYYIAGIEDYLDNDSVTNKILVEELQNEFKVIIKLANYKLEDTFWNNLKSAENKSFKIAEKSGMNYSQQQEFLILKSENERLNYLINYFLSIKEKVNNANSILKIIKNNGYLN